MRRRISWLVVATTSTVVVSFVIPLCLLVRAMAEDRAMAATDQEARNVAILVSTLSDDPQLPGLVEDLDRRGTPSTSVLMPDHTVLGADTAMRGDPEVRRAARGEGFQVVDGAGGRVLLPVVTESGTAVVRSSVTREELSRLPWVMNYQSRSAFTSAERQVQQLGIEPNVEVVVESFLAIPHFIAGTRRVGIIHRALVPLAQQACAVRVVGLPFEPTPIVNALWWHPVHTHDPEHTWMRSLFEEAGRVVAAGEHT